MRAGEDLAGGHVALAVGVDPRAARDVRASRSVPSALDADLLRRRQALDQPRLERRAARPRRRRGRRDRGTAPARRTRRSSRVPMPACWAAAGVGQSVIDQRLAHPRLAQRRRRPRRARQPRRVDGGERVRVVGGLDAERGVQLARLGELGGRERVQRRVGHRGPVALALPGQRDAQQRPRAALQDLPLQREQQRRGERRRGRPGPAARAARRGSSRPAAARSRRRSSRRLHVGEVLGQVRAQRLADPAPLVRGGEAEAREQLLLPRDRLGAGDRPAAPRGARRGTRRRAARRPRGRAGCRPATSAYCARVAGVIAPRSTSTCRARRGTRSRARGASRGGGPSSPSPGR